MVDVLIIGGTVWIGSSLVVAVIWCLVKRKDRDN